MPTPLQYFKLPDSWKNWLYRYRVPLLWALLLVLVLPMRDLWAPDEPDFAQCVREMRERGSWLLPYLNGTPYSEKPILFYWLLKACAVGGDWMTHGLGFTHGIAAWALRVPSVAGSIAFAFAFRRWTARFFNEAAAEPATLILCTTNIWFWQSQFIQIDFVFCALLAWAWLAFLAGYLLNRGLCERRREGEEIRFFLGAYVALALAFLAKGPLALILSIPLLVIFLAWQRDWGALKRIRLGKGLILMLVIIAPWYVAAGIRGGGRYFYELVVYQNFIRATHAWDHIQPWWRYVEYLVSDSFPWCLLLPPLAAKLWRQRRSLDPCRRFMLLAFAVPFVLLSCSQSKQGKYVMMVYPFLALLFTDLWHSDFSRSHRKYGSVLGVALGIPGLLLLGAALFKVGAAKLDAPILPFQMVIAAMAIILLGFAFLTLYPAPRLLHPVKSASLGLALVFLVGGTFGFRLLDPLKNYREWTRRIEPLTAGRRVFYWQTMHCGVMVYSSHQMPELHTWEELERLGPEDRLVTIDRDWSGNGGGMNPKRREQFEVLLRLKVGGGDSLLLRRRRSYQSIGNP